MKRLENIEFAIFDMDGTILDSMWAWDTAADRLLAALNITPRPEMREDIRPMTVPQVADYLIKEYCLPQSHDDLMQLFDDTMVSFYKYEADYKEGALELLNTLKERGIGMCLATATDRHMVDIVLKRLGIYDMFDFIITCTEVGASKASPLVFEECLKRSGSERSKTWVFEDSAFAVTTAKNAGFPVLAVYDKSSEMFEDDKKRDADIYLHSLKELVL